MIDTNELANGQIQVLLNGIVVATFSHPNRNKNLKMVDLLIKALFNEDVML